MQIVGVQFDPQENTNVLTPPAILTGQDTSVGRMLEPNVPEGFGDPGPTVPLFTQQYHQLRGQASIYH